MKTNRYFERAESVKEFELKGSALFEQFPTSEWEYLVAETKPLGVLKDGLLKRVSTPPGPGAKVRIAENENLEKFYTFDKEKGMHLGSLEYHDLDVKLNLTKLLQKHCAILAQSGFGKSVTASVIIEELLDRPKEHGRIATIVFDPHGEYKSFAKPTKGKGVDSPKALVGGIGTAGSDYSDKTLLVKGQNIRIGMPRLSVGMIASIIPGLSGAQKRDLRKILSTLNAEMKSGTGPYDLNKVKKTIFADEGIKGNTKGALLAWLDELSETKMFAATDNPSISDLVKPGKLTVIDLSDLVDMRKKQIILSYFANKLFHERKEKRIPPFVLILEEAHQFVPQYSKDSDEGSVSRGIIQTIAREGRKFGCSLCLISQRPVQLDTTTLS
ncbi:MAG: ATP-binding protein, partial [Candidatus Diapherotrites archaeon]|nr:ATP-binding protein [Candidatus Diapherotrites archaeon]